MNKIFKTSVAAAGLMSIATSALAIDAKDIINRMETKGYTKIETFRTLFGNTRVVGFINGLEHEFVISKSGSVLRETLKDEDDDKSAGFLWPKDDDDDNSWREKADADDSWDDDKDAEYEREYQKNYVDVDDTDTDDNDADDDD